MQILSQTQIIIITMLFNQIMKTAMKILNMKLSLKRNKRKIRKYVSNHQALEIIAILIKNRF